MSACFFGKGDLDKCGRVGKERRSKSFENHNDALSHVGVKDYGLL
jgi:hypothetical protein